MNARVRKLGDELIISLDAGVAERLSLSEGDTLQMAERGGEIVLQRSDERSDRLARGRAFIDQYRETFQALAK